MIRHAMTALIPIPDDADGGDGVHVYWDALTGEVDYDAAPLTAAPIPILPGQARAKGWGRSPWGVGDLAGRALRHGRFDTQRWGIDPWGDPPAYAALRFGVPRGYGVARFGAQLMAPTGDATGDPIEFVAVVASATPRGVRKLALASFDAESSVATFDVAMASE